MFLAKALWGCGPQSTGSKKSHMLSMLGCSIPSLGQSKMSHCPWVPGGLLWHWSREWPDTKQLLGERYIKNQPIDTNNHCCQVGVSVLLPTRQGSGWAVGSPQPDWLLCCAALPPGSTPEWSRACFPPATSKVPRAGSSQQRFHHMSQILHVAVTCLLQMFPQEVKRKKVRVAGASGGDQQRRLSSEARSSSYHDVGECKVGHCWGAGLVVWDGPERLSWAGLVHGLVGHEQWAQGSLGTAQLQGQCHDVILLGWELGAADHPPYTHWCQLCTPLQFPVLRGAPARLCRCRGTLG